MVPQILIPLLICLTSATSRETGKTFRTMPTISNSLVNLGKMEISFYFNGKPDTTGRSDHIIQPISPFTLSKPEPVDEPCVCSNLRNIKDSLFTNPAEIINRILKSNDLFSNKEPITSTLCCDTHEHEQTVFFEIAPSQKKPNPTRTNSFPPFIFDSIMPKPMSSPLKPKAVEILLFPKRKDMATFDLPRFLPKKNALIKDRIQIVGDKYQSDIKPVSSSSVKKDLMEKIETKEANKQETPKVKADAIAKPNAL